MSYGFTVMPLIAGFVNFPGIKKVLEPGYIFDFFYPRCLFGNSILSLKPIKVGFVKDGIMDILRSILNGKYILKSSCRFQLSLTIFNVSDLSQNRGDICSFITENTRDYLRVSTEPNMMCRKISERKTNGVKKTIPRSKMGHSFSIISNHINKKVSQGF